MLGVFMLYLGLHSGNSELVGGGIFLAIVMCCFTFYIFGISDQKKESNRLRYIAWRQGTTRGGRFFRGLVAFLAVCTILHIIFQSLKRRGMFR